ncbi:hypothetical protein ACRAWF_28240 [Streptomyces sp. L7]
MPGMLPASSCSSPDRCRCRGGWEEFAPPDALAAFADVAPAPRASCHRLASTPTSPERFHVEANQARSAPARTTGRPRAREQLLGLRQHQRVRTPLPPGPMVLGQLGRVDPAPRGGALIAAAPGPRHRPVVRGAWHPSHERAKPVPALPCHHREPRRPGSPSFCSRAAWRSIGRRHWRTVSGRDRNAAMIRPRSWASAASRMAAAAGSAAPTARGGSRPVRFRSTAAGHRPPGSRPRSTAAGPPPGSGQSTAPRTAGEAARSSRTGVPRSGSSRRRTSPR